MKIKIVTLVLALTSVSCANTKNEIKKVQKVFARATQFHKNDPGCDPWTKRGTTCTQIRLSDSCDNTIGMVAIDPKIIPFGSLIYSPENERFYLACNIGGAVSSRVAAKKLADKKDLSDKFREALVLDFYAKKEIIDNHFGDFFVILHEGEDFRFDLSKSEQEIRLKPEFWIDRIHKILKESSTKKDTLTAILCRLQEM